MPGGAKVITPPAPPHLYAKQDAAIHDPARYVFIDASTKSGKTVGCLSWAYEQAIARDDRRGIWVEPTFPMARDIGYSRMVAMLQRVDPKKTIWRSKDTTLEVAFVNGSLIRFKGGENPDNIYGEDYHFAVVDEASRCKHDAWIAVRSTLSHTRGPARIIGNVKGRKNWAFQLGQKAKAGEPGMAYHKLTAYDAVEGGVMSLEEIEDARRTLPDHAFRELYLAEPTEDGANPFDLRAIAECVGPMSSEPVEAFGVDLAKSHDWTVVVGLDAEHRVCVFDRWQGDWRSTRDRLVGIIGDVPACVDSTGVGDPIVEDLQAELPAVTGFKFTQTSKQQLMEGLRAALQRREVGIVDGPMRDELESFEFEHTATGVRYSSPAGMHDDCVCGLALAVHASAASGRGRFMFSLGRTENMNRTVSSRAWRDVWNEIEQ